MSNWRYQSLFLNGPSFDGNFKFIRFQRVNKQHLIKKKTIRENVYAGWRVCKYCVSLNQNMKSSQIILSSNYSCYPRISWSEIYNELDIKSVKFKA